MTTYSPTWILVAGASQARLFKYDGFKTPIQPLREWEHPQSRARNQDLASDRPGRVTQSHAGPHPGKGSKSGMEAELTPKKVEHERFARELAAELDKIAAEDTMARFVLVANPEFLGQLRQVESEQVRKHTVASL